jgi:hypothetical protein
MLGWPARLIGLCLLLVLIILALPLVKEWWQNLFAPPLLDRLEF